MKLNITVGLAVVLMAAVMHGAFAKMAPLKYEDSAARIPGEYIVVMKENVTDSEASRHMVEVRRMMASGERSKNSIIGDFKIGSVHGYGAKIDDDEMRDSVRSMDIISYMECNQIYNATHTGSCCGCVAQQNAPWGLVRTTFRHKLPWTSTYEYRAHAGHDVTVYILDTGIDISHTDFGNRAFLDSGSPPYPLPYSGYDFNGHGTHVAGTVMSDTFGVAKKATAVSIPVLNQFGSGSTFDVITGIIWVALYRHSPGDKSIINMSLGGPFSFLMNFVTNLAVDLGVHVVVAAGNSGGNACNYSPASATKAVTVAASDRDDRIAFFSNFGSCVDVIAPGVCVTSTWLNNGIRTIQGTSMAAPHVAGVLAKYLSIFPNTTPAALKSVIISTACQNQVSNFFGGTFLGGTPNRLVFNDCATDNSVVYPC